MKKIGRKFYHPINSVSYAKKAQNALLRGNIGIIKKKVSIFVQVVVANYSNQRLSSLLTKFTSGIIKAILLKYIFFFRIYY